MTDQPYEAVSFESNEELVEYLAAARERLKNRPLADEQRALGYGGHGVRFMDGLTIFVDVVSIPDLITEDLEVQENIDRMQITHDMLWCLSFSTVVPDGEYGYHHRSVLWPIERRTFEAARQAGWDLGSIPTWAHDTLVMAWTGFTDHNERSTE